MPETFAISDTHFGHTNVIEYCNRPFKTIQDMEDTLVRNWNRVVDWNDTVIHVGDFSFGSLEEISRVRSLLKGKIILVRGNHDRSTEQMKKAGFDFVTESIIINHCGKRAFFCHYPINRDRAIHDIEATRAFLRLVKADKYVHGHTHNNTPFLESKISYNVSCEGIRYTPKNLDEFI